MVESGARFCRGDLIRCGQLPILAPQAPEPDDGTGGDVEGSVRLGSESTGLFEEGEKVVTHGDGLTCGGFGELIDLGLG